MDAELKNGSWQWYRDAVRSWLEDPGVEEFQELNLTSLKMDEAYMTGESPRDVGVYAVSDDCFRGCAVFIECRHQRPRSRCERRKPRLMILKCVYKFAPCSGRIYLHLAPVFV
ncbi:hypothetical protein EVAR_96831_1 [Eumeta japonica]|uniref:Uncharacterized protein n=1 Tax=Eumeta variegata TaxID=151549 RepID=A0A4C1WCN9_EUMVA|nr:hypothetical protein EVAR_96831_1 [Eumeta japonica]